GLLRTNFNEGTSRNVVTPRGVTLDKRYTVAMTDKPASVKELLGGNASATSDFEGRDINGNSKDYYIEGIVVKFDNSAREKEGNVVVGNAQIQLVCRDRDDMESRSFFPVAMISQTDPKQEDKVVKWGRWTFERPKTFIASAGTADAPRMAFEFLVPKG